MGAGRNHQHILLTALLIFGLFSFLGSAHAMKWLIGSDTEFSCDVTLTYGVGMRVTEMDPAPPWAAPTDPGFNAYVTSINRDDSKRNFDQWDLYNNKITALADIELKWKSFGVFVRPKAFYDHVYMTDNSNDSPGTNNAYLTPHLNLDSSNQWADEIEDVHGRNAEILDAFAYANFWLGNNPFEIRVGNQVISWGESTYVPGISSAQAPVDASAATAVGTEVKEIYLPTGAVYVQTGIGDVGLRAYYQWEWERMRLMEGGTFFAQFDAVDTIDANFLGGSLTQDGDMIPVTRGEDVEPRDDGQYGVAVSYILPWGATATELGAYYLNYHEKNFTLELGGTEYWLAFDEDIKLYGLSISTTLGDTQLYGEVSYRDNFRCMTEDMPPLHGQGDYMQAQAGFTHILSPGPFGVIDRTILAGEIAYGRQYDLEDTEIGKNEEGLTYVAVMMNEWFQVFNGTDLGLDFILMDTPIGTIPQFNLFEHYSAFSITGKVTYNDVWKANLVYENRFQDHFLKDMDTLSLKLSYSF